MCSHRQGGGCGEAGTPSAVLSVHPSQGEGGGWHPLCAHVPSTTEGRTWYLSWPLHFPPQHLGLHKALGYDLIYQLLPDDLICPPLCQRLPKSLTMHSLDPRFQPHVGLTRAPDPTCRKITHLPPQTCPSSSPSIHPTRATTRVLTQSHTHTITHTHTHTHTQLDHASHARSRYRSCSLVVFKSPQMGLEGETHRQCGHYLHKLANLGLKDQRG